MLVRSQASPRGVTAANTGHADRTLRRSYPFGAPPCRIYRPSPSPLQSARTASRWLLEFEPGPNPCSQLQLSFPSLDTAVSYAERHGLRYHVIDPPVRQPTQPVLHIQPDTGGNLWSI
jgi:hypothetical protein